MLRLFLISIQKKNKFNKIALTLSFLTALMITSYSLVDGLSIRYVQNPYTYLYWMLLLNGTPALAISLMYKGSGLRKIERDMLLKGFVFAILAPLAYGLTVWCMLYLPIAYASAIRETSIIFATLLGIIFLGEKDGKSRIFPALFIVLGIGVLFFEI